MSQIIPDPRSTRPCLACGEPMTELRIVKMYDGGSGALHDCGTVYTRDFMHHHFGLEWTLEGEPLPDPRPDGKSAYEFMWAE